MINVTLIDVIVWSKSHLLLSNTCLKAMDLKTQWTNFLRDLKLLGTKFQKHAVNISAPFIGMAVGAKTKKPKVAQASTNNLKNISGGKILSLTDMHENGLRLKVM